PSFAKQGKTGARARHAHLFPTRSRGGGVMRPVFDPSFRQVAEHPLRFLLQTLKAFRANQGMLLAGAVAYYALLSIVPLMILIVIALSHLVPQHVLLAALG